MHEAREVGYDELVGDGGIIECERTSKETVACYAMRAGEFNPGGQDNGYRRETCQISWFQGYHESVAAFPKARNIRDHAGWVNDRRR
jgi:hypothetical protein